MAIEITIDESRIENLSNGAKETLKKQVDQYVDNVIKEANLIEEGMREDGASTEITSNIIITAVRKNKNSLSKKSSIGMIFVKVASALSLLVTGFLFDSNGYHENAFKLFAFIFCLIVACVSTVIQYIKE